jgi:hypothetical protein
MERHHRELRLPTFPRPYPVWRPSRPVKTERLRPLVLLVLILQCLTLLFLVTGPIPVRLQPRGIPSPSQISLSGLHASQAISSTLLRGSMS